MTSLRLAAPAVPAPRRGRGADRGGHRHLAGEAGRHGDGEPDHRGHRDGQGRGRAAQPVRGRGGRAAGARGPDGGRRHANHLGGRARGGGKRAGGGRPRRARPGAVRRPGGDRGRRAAPLVGGPGAAGPARRGTAGRAGRLRRQGRATTRRPRKAPAGNGSVADPGLSPGRADGAPGGHPSVLAKPPVRKLARELGVDLGGLAGSGPGGSITRDDVQQAAAGGMRPGGRRSAGLAWRRSASRSGGVRKHTAAAVTAERTAGAARHRVPAGRRGRDGRGGAAPAGAAEFAGYGSRRCCWWPGPC